ncbi:hypothetical protein BCON_0066g00310 [Botryotinia convoluta]|uniref:Uncharacterized protein n=1 Tax=Botryotinia convoluta TaxID=54673 RepID=A0A4Z1ICU3_9HELO|nr:hypothetical protein BCON_0066g00310 [Botryotinia convoluta]
MSNTASKENTETESSKEPTRPKVRTNFLHRKLMTRLIHNRLYPRTIKESFAINIQSIWLVVRIKGRALGMP